MPSIPRARGRPLLGYLPEMQRDPIGLLMGMAARFGAVANFRVGPQNIFLINHPDYIREVLQTQSRKFIKSHSTRRMRLILGEGLLTSEQAVHQRQRRLAQPAFYRNRLDSYAAAMVDEAIQARESWIESVPLDVDREMMRLTLNVVTRTLFNSRLSMDAREIGESVNNLLRMFPLLVLPYSEYLHKIPVLPVTRRLLAARDRLHQVVMRLVRERRASGADTGDLLSMLIQARDQEDGSAMSDDQVRDEALTILLAGHETTAVALSWTWYLLDNHPEADRRLREEVENVLGERPATLADLERLKYTSQVFSESMRLYPPAWAMGRLALEDVEFDGYRFPKNAVLIISPYVMHRTAAYWPDPERFDPDRFAGEEQAKRPKFTYFPFGGGPRICIGERFAWMEGVLVLATLAQRWRFRVLPGQTIEPKPLITLRMRNGLKVAVETVVRAPGSSDAQAGTHPPAPM